MTFARHSRISMTAVAVATSVAIATLAGCATPGVAIEGTAQGRASREAPAAPKSADFPSIESARWKQGAFPSIEALRAMNTGMGKDQVRGLLSWPHFSEGLGGDREWNYIFHFRTGRGAEFVTCQYMVRFNGDVLTNGMYWKDPDCARRLDSPVAESVTVPVTVPPAAVSVAPPIAASTTPRAAHRVTLSADGLFRFGRSGAADLMPEGRHKVDAFAAELQRRFRAVDSITITGHTDRLGTDASNQALSQARANTIRDLLVAQGIAPTVIRTLAAGQRHPVTSGCSHKQATAALVACLQPDRRVELEVSGYDTRNAEEKK